MNIYLWLREQFNSGLSNYKYSDQSIEQFYSHKLLSQSLDTAAVIRKLGQLVNEKQKILKIPAFEYLHKNK